MLSSKSLTVVMHTHKINDYSALELHVYHPNPSNRIIHCSFITPTVHQFLKWKTMWPTIHFKGRSRTCTSPIQHSILEEHKLMVWSATLPLPHMTECLHCLCSNYPASMLKGSPPQRNLLGCLTFSKINPTWQDLCKPNVGYGEVDSLQLNVHNILDSTLFSVFVQRKCRCTSSLQ